MTLIRPFAGQTVPLRADFRNPDGTAMDNVAGVTFEVRRLNGAEVIMVPGAATAEENIWTAAVVMPVRGTWEVQARCTEPQLSFTERERIAVEAPLSFTEPD